uniref:Uncharacterized protein n=1 Tax=Rousettus aegyptiacus TaxID=9407 RepID=A0A7J8C2G5_ROUAE|nr:hypothetical protein HJG63_009332 [Rousettus aegyptiacus]
MTHWLTVENLSWKAKYDAELLEIKKKRMKEQARKKSSPLRVSILHFYSLESCYSKCGFWDSRINITWEPAGNEDLGSPLQTYRIRIDILTRSSGIMHEDVLDAAWSRGRGEYRSTDEHFTSTSEECCLGLHTQPGQKSEFPGTCVT